MKKVLFVATVDSHIELFHLPYLKMFKDRGYEVHVATDSDKPIKYCDKKIKLSIKRSPFKISNLKAIRELKKVVNTEKYDIVHCHTPMGGVVARFAAKKARRNGTRVIYTAHGFHFYTGAPILNWVLFYPIEKWLSKYTDTLITINTEDFKRAKRKFGKRCFDIQYVPGVGVDEKKFEKKLTKKEKQVLRKSLGLKDDDKVLIFPAELSKRKNQIWLIKTLEPLFREDRKYHLLLPGKDSLNGECQKLVRKIGLENQMHFLGFRDDIINLLQISNIAVSSAKQEGLPVNLMEAAFMGLPIVATGCRGNRDVCDRYSNGHIVYNMEEFLDELNVKADFVDDNLKEFLFDNVKIMMDRIYKDEKIVKEKYPIDFVVLWVDGSDPKWLSKKQKYKPEIDVQNESARYRDWGIFKYWFRGVEKYAPWVNHIYLVTDEQVPEWLNVNHPKLTVIDHKEIMDKKDLPTFNSQAIEMNLHRISGLAEHFVYFNDDMFLVNKVKSNDFFRRGLPVAIANINAATGMEGDQMYARTMFNNILLINRHFKKKEVVTKHLPKWLNLKYGSFNLRTLSQIPYPYFTGYKPHHVPAPLLKSTFEKIWRVEEDVIKETCSHRFRHPHDLNQDVFSQWQICSNQFVPGNKFKGRHLQLNRPTDISKVAKSLKSKSVKTLCINDSLPDLVSETDIDRVKEELQKIFDKKLPTKSAYENNLRVAIGGDKKKAPLVSVVVPIYNVKDYLKKCVDSILSQTYKNIEIILVDDGSTDGSGEIADDYVKKYKNVRVIHKKNGGLSSARNVGIDVIEGEWVLFIDSDDYIRNDCVLRVLGLVSADDIDIVTYNFEAFSNDGSKLKHSPSWPNNIISGVSAIDDMLKNRHPAYICMSAFRVRLFRENKIRFPEGQEFEDIATRIKLLFYARRVAFTNEKLYYYLIRKDSITGNTISKSRCSDYLKAVSDVEKFLLRAADSKAFVFLEYFEFYSLIILLNYLARERETFNGSNECWRQVHKKLRKVYLRTKFPTVKNRVIYTLLLSLSSNRILYSEIYRALKGAR